MSTLDRFGARQRVIPAEVSGPLRTWRTRAHAILLLVFLLLPWLRINGLQAVWLDIPGRRFEIFGVLFLSHDAPLLFFIMILMVLALAFVTAVWGRVWCGWACPQTVFIDAVYRRIEIWVEGNYRERRKLHAQPLGPTKLLKVGLKWFLFFVVSSLIAHSFIAYFTGSVQLIEMLQGSPSENWGYFLTVTLVTTGLLFNFGWFREQFCIVVCPYGRFQSVLMDQNTVTVMYDEKRGEPRKGILNPANLRGDCVSCNRCVEVCPTGIDIRNGLQMECIGCTACIDACNVIMKKVNKPEGLIRHMPVSGQKAEKLRPRLVGYAVLGLLATLSLGYSLLSREAYSVTILRATDMPYQILNEEKIVNHFKVRFMNQSLQPQSFAVSLAKETINDGVQLTQGKALEEVKAGASAETHLFVIFPKNALNAAGKKKLHFEVREASTERRQVMQVTAVGPGQPQP